MSIASAIVLYCVIWALVFYMVNPLWQTSQSEDGEVVPGTPASAPVDPMIRKKAIVTTVIATVLFALAFLRAAIVFYARLGVTVERVMTDNGSCYKSHAFRHACKELGLRHIRTKPYTPKTNGKAERFIKTALNEWAYARASDTSDQRAAHLPAWIHSYNWHRPHGGIGSAKPISRLGLNGDNLLRLHS